MRKDLPAILLATLAIVSLTGCIGSNQQTPTGNAIADTGGVDGNFIAKASQVPENTIREFTYKGEPAILVNFGGEYAAYLNKCTHQGAQFNESSLVNDRIQCPRHGATFKPTTGEYLGHANGNNFGLKGLSRINITLDNGGIYAE